VFDPHGAPVDHQHLDSAGNWVDDAAQQATTATAISIDYQGHEYDPAATIDLNADGRSDSGVVADAAGDRYLVTDYDGDGRADHVEVYGADGRALEGANVADDGTLVPDDHTAGLDGSAGTTISYVVDPTTGEWTTR